MEIKDYPSGKTAVYAFKDQAAPKAAILFVHGIGEHTGRYRRWAERFNEKDIAVRAFDLPGHGNSEGRRGVIPSLGKVYDTIDAIITELSRELPGVPFFIYGNSLGGGLVLNYLIKRKPELTGAIVTSPWVLLTETPPKAKIILAKVVGKVIPGFVQPSGLKTEYLSRNPEVVNQYRNDPLVHGMISASLYNDMTVAAGETLARASEITLPLLLAHGRDDMITSPAGSMLVAEAAPKSTLKLWEGGYHELHNDIISDEHFEFIMSWIDTLL
jgi:acylglycerol lipase